LKALLTCHKVNAIRHCHAEKRIYPFQKKIALFRQKQLFHQLKKSTVFFVFAIQNEQKEIGSFRKRSAIPIVGVVFFFVNGVTPAI
jgi:hypothetical protein